MTLNTHPCGVHGPCMLQLHKTTAEIRRWARLIVDLERKYGRTPRKYLAIILSALLLQRYMGGVRYAICIDQSSLRRSSALPTAP